MFFSLLQRLTLGVILLLLAMFSFALPMARAESLPTALQLPLKLATEAGLEAIAVCRQSGYAVTVTVVNAEGQRQVVLRDEAASPYTLDNSFNKAYSVISLGKIYQKDTTTELAELLLNKPTTPFLASLPGITLGSGGVAIKARSQWMGGLGVSGSPGGPLDEACAKAAVAKIKNRLLR
jgi:uncharacterized protein GlcG (DUF336 family)